MLHTDIRLRIAPSPTGEPHVGTAYTALFNYLYAKRLGGAFVLRIEDTDQTRSTREFEDKVLQALRWTGLDWSEGPDKGGPYGPYRQSERKDIYQPYVTELIEKGHAFKCFCSPERLDAMRAAQRTQGLAPKYDGLCLHKTAEDVEARLARGESHVVRMKIPSEGTCKFTDGVYGDVEIPWNSVDMQVIQKADGMPTYHLANVVDDHLMKISHVARGEEWVSSVPKHILLYRYFGWETPHFIHLPLMRNADKSKLSKRKNPTSISYFAALGYLPEALMNFLGLLFIQIGEGEEMMSMEELIEKFDPDNLSKSGAIFDTQKLDWLNGRWLREKLSPQDYLEQVRVWANENNRLIEGLQLAQSRIAKLSDLPDLLGFLFKADAGVTAASFDGLKTSREETLTILQASSVALEGLPEWTSEMIETNLRELANREGRKLRVFLPPLFVAVSGSARSLPLFDSMVLVGRAGVRQRLKLAIAALSDARSKDGGSGKLS